MRGLPLDRLRPSPVAVVTALGVVIMDQVTKMVARSRLAGADHHVVGPLWLRLSHNPGFAFSTLRSHPAMSALLGVVALLVVLYGTARARPVAPALAFGLVLGGGLSNFVERVSRGSVSDFVAVGSFPAFNLADASITVGVVTLLVLSLTKRPVLRS